MRTRAGLLLPALLALTGCWAMPAAVVRAPTGGLDLTVVHVNDMHARYEQTNALSGTCSDKAAQDGECYGGQARVATVIKEARKEADNVLVLNAGDTYQGTVYYSIFKWNISAEFVNMLEFDALTLGNHEFDDHTAGLVPFIEHLKVPLIVANVDFSGQPEYAGLPIRKSVVLERGGVKIGVIGYLTPDTVFLSSVDNVTFTSEIEALSAEAKALKAQGVNIIIGLGHSGYDRDQEIAAKVEDMDLVIGGHSHTFLYTGTPPDSDVPLGLYPTFVRQPTTGREVPVVQAYAFTKYAGKLKLKFDEQGELVNITGLPILLNKDVAEDPDTLAAVMRWKSELDQKVNTPLAKTTVLLDGQTCRFQECNLGNLIADAFVFGHAEYLKVKTGWTDAPIALVNGGSIRRSIDASTNNDQITIKDVMEVMPFDNLEVLLRIRGSVLLEALEHAVSEYVVGNAWKGQFLQLSGVRVTYDVSRTPGDRVVSALVRCGNCTIPSYSDLDVGALYGVVVSGFMAAGGDGFTMLAHNEGAETLQDTDAAVVEHYLSKRGLVYPAVEGRVNFASASPSTSTSAPPSTSTSAPSSTPSPGPGSSTTVPPDNTTPSSSHRTTPTSLLLACVLVLAALVR